MTWNQAQEIAHDAIKSSLEKYSLSSELKSQLVLGSFIDQDLYVFELYIPNEVPENATVITRTEVDPFSGQTKVQVFLDETEQK
jgi:hypothetical protein